MKKITFLTGYYGSGKSEITVNLAIENKVDMVVDLDIINPYFRTREMEDMLKEKGIETISSDLSYRSHIDLPYISKKVFMPFQNKDLTAIYDLGGNDLGAKLLRQFEDYDTSDVDLFLVINIYREETDSVEKIVTLIKKIEGMGGIKVTGLINNTNLLKSTTVEEIKKGEELIKKVSEITKLDIVYTTVWEKVAVENLTFAGQMLKLKLYFRKNWL